MFALRSLTARLVVTAVALVAVVSLLVAAIATVAIRSSLMDRLDSNVLSSVRRVGDGDRDQDNAGRYPRPTPSNQGPGTLIAFMDTANGPDGYVLTKEINGTRQLSTTALKELGQVPVDTEVHSVDLTTFGSYRVTATAGPNGRTFIGLPTKDVDQTVNALVGYEILLILMGVLTAAGLGTLLVRRQLRPLNEVAETAHAVAELPLSSGEIDLTDRVPAHLTDRVPAHLTDERTEVGRMGAALNVLLAHVETSLEARHRSEQQVRQFVGDASHELRTPLATIHGYAELSRRTPDDPIALSMALAKVETEADRMSSLVEDLLLLARLDAGRPLERTEVDVTRLLLESVVDSRVLSPGHKWQLDLPDEPITVTGDAQRLHQVVTNLLGNARHHTPPGTTVTVSATTAGDGVRIVVHDDGPGLPEGLTENAFERFSRGDSSRTRASGGAGLGLSLVSAIAQAHGGRASVASQPGSTTFTVLLPH